MTTNTKIASAFVAVVAIGAFTWAVPMGRDGQTALIKSTPPICIAQGQACSDKYPCCSGTVCADASNADKGTSRRCVPISTPTATPNPAGPPTVTVTYPNKYFETRVGRPMKITWDSSRCDTVTLNWIHDVTQAYNRIATDIPNSGSYDWTVQANPNNPNGRFYAKINVLCSQGPYVFPNPVAIDSSDTRFYVRP